jgi:hypothetical protein
MSSSFWANIELKKKYAIPAIRYNSYCLFLGTLWGVGQTFCKVDLNL